jgi:hypothetical protein
MNRMKSLFPLAAAIFLSLLTGCVPYPHTTARSFAVSGRVVDARTHAPIKKARVRLEKSPHHTTYTDADGRFRMGATWNFHWAIITPGGDWPKKDSYTEISHPGYQTYGFFNDRGGDLGDLPLKPEP